KSFWTAEKRKLTSRKYSNKFRAHPLPHPNSNRVHPTYRTQSSRRSACKPIEWKFPGIQKNQIGWFALKPEKKSSAATSRFPARRPNLLSAPPHKKSPKMKATRRQ